MVELAEEEITIIYFTLIFKIKVFTLILALKLILKITAKEISSWFILLYFGDNNILILVRDFLTLIAAFCAFLV
jgi:hypothetical protein